MITGEPSRAKVGLDHDPEVHLIQTLAKNWWLLALCGLLDAILAFMNLSMQNPDGSLTLRIFVPMSTGMLMCRLAVAAGACTIAAGIWRSRKGKSWLLVLNGLAFSAYGLIPLILWTRPLSFRLFALLLVVMAMSIGILELATARTLRRQVADQWFLSVAGAASICFALAFLALGFGWMKLEPGSQWRGFLWLGSYFGFSAICTLGLALRLHSRGLSQFGQWEALPPLGNPKYVH
jgi:uncharacterized membrane protein HdeD (DUF308 family)